MRKVTLSITSRDQIKTQLKAIFSKLRKQ